MGEGVELMGLSARQVRRVRAAYRREGAGALAHGNRGRRPYNAVDAGVAQRVVALTRERYIGVNQQHLTELLEEDEKIRLSRSTVRRVLLRAGIRSPQKRRAPKHRSRRERKPREGMLLQVDGSPHDWLEGRGPRLCLVGAIDDATSHVPYAVFRRQEDIQGYFAMLRRIVETKGVPLSLYHDKHTIFLSPKKEVETVEEQLAGKRRLTQVGRALAELGITSIPADSPEAKGRIERLWRTFQDRLVSELRLADVRDIDAANRMLHRFLPRYNRRFVVPPAEPECAYRPVDPGLNLATVFCLKHMRTVGTDNVVRFKGRRLQVHPSHHRTSYARTRVEVHERMNGSLAIYHQSMRLTTTIAPLEAPALRALSNAQQQVAAISELQTQSPTTHHHKPAPDHPWRTSFKPQRRQRTLSLNT
ncbi:ISNCY family transposase [Candidatus Bipolaricaulota bacterium]|nr:ISNCY family transposase [Candidatus Bipolaricaulota bacterium]